MSNNIMENSRSIVEYYATIRVFSVQSISMLRFDPAIAISLIICLKHSVFLFLNLRIDPPKHIFVGRMFYPPDLPNSTVLLTRNLFIVSIFNVKMLWLYNMVFQDIEIRPDILILAWISSPSHCSHLAHSRNIQNVVRVQQLPSPAWIGHDPHESSPLPCIINYIQS